MAGDFDQAPEDYIAELREQICDLAGDDARDEVLFMDGFEAALVGVVTRIGLEPIACYDLDAVLAILRNRDGMTEEEALEHFEYNLIGGYVGERTPCFIRQLAPGAHLERRTLPLQYQPSTDPQPARTGDHHA